jgi:hypothetical protein
MRSFTLILIFCLFLLPAVAQKTGTSKPPARQEKTDVILKVNGDELIGKVTEVGDADLKFIYQGEELAYTIKKSDILKVTFASGRIEFFNKPPLPSEKKEIENQPISGVEPNTKRTGGLESHHNKVAILPFGFIRDNQDAGPEMGYKAQNDVYAYLNKHSAGLTIVDPRTTNALLARKGITPQTLRGLTMDEICDILDVEYVVAGGITQNRVAQTTSSSSSGKVTNTWNGNKDKRSGSVYSNSTSLEYYSNQVSIEIFTDKNDNIYSENRKGLLNSTDGSYSSPLEYLLKRCPLYRK